MCLPTDTAPSPLPPHHPPRPAARPINALTARITNCNLHLYMHSFILRTPPISYHYLLVYLPVISPCCSHHHSRFPIPSNVLVLINHLTLPLVVSFHASGIPYSLLLSSHSRSSPTLVISADLNVSHHLVFPDIPAALGHNSTPSLHIHTAVHLVHVH